MGFFSNLFRKDTPNPTTGNEQESTEMKIINQVRSIPGVDTVFKYVGLLDTTTAQLIPDISIIGKHYDKSEEYKSNTVTLKLCKGETTHLLKIFVSDSFISVHGINKNNSGHSNYLYEKFDKESKVATFFRIGSGKDDISVTEFIAERDSTDIRKVHCTRTGNSPINGTADISLSSADISTLDTFYNITDPELHHLLSTHSQWYHLKDKVLKSANAHGCGNFIAKAHNYGYYDLDTILSFESNRLRIKDEKADASKITPHTPLTPVTPPTDKFGYRISKTPQEQLLDSQPTPSQTPEATPDWLKEFE